MHLVIYNTFILGHILYAAKTLPLYMVGSRWHYLDSTAHLEDHLAKWLIVLTTSHDNLEIVGSIPGCVQFLCRVHMDSLRLRSPCGVRTDPHSLYGLAQNTWGSVNYWLKVSSVASPAVQAGFRSRGSHLSWKGGHNVLKPMRLTHDVLMFSSSHFLIAT